MSTLQELLAQKEALDRRIKEATSKGRTEAIAQVKALMADHGLTVADLSRSAGKGKGARKSKTSPGAKVAAKYRNSSTGETWSGRGLQPRWLKAALAGGKSLTDFAA